MSSENKRDFSNHIIVVAIIAVTVYTAIHLFFSWHDKYVPVQLTVSWFGFWTGEVFVMGGIEVVKRKAGVSAEMLNYRQSNK